jgi:Ion channel
MRDRIGLKTCSCCVETAGLLAIAGLRYRFVGIFRSLCFDAENRHHGARSWVAGRSTLSLTGHSVKQRTEGGLRPEARTGRPEGGLSRMQTERIAILIPLAAGASAIVCTIMIHALALGGTVILVRRERKLGRTGTSFWIDVAIVAVAISFALAAHLVEIALWAVLFVICGEFPELGAAFNHSAVNYTTLGYGDVIMTPSWRLLGPLEAANGMLMFGVSTAMIFAVIQRLVEARFVDLRD